MTSTRSPLRSCMTISLLPITPMRSVFDSIGSLRSRGKFR